jgi:hypothetical protein
MPLTALDPLPISAYYPHCLLQGRNGVDPRPAQRRDSAAIGSEIQCDSTASRTGRASRQNSLPSGSASMTQLALEGLADLKASCTEIL